MRTIHFGLKAASRATAALVACCAISAFAQTEGPSHRTLLNNQRVTVVEIVFEPGVAEPEHGHGGDVLVIAVTGGEMENVVGGNKETILAWPGDVHFFPKGSRHSWRNPGNERVVLRAVWILQ